MTSATCHCSPSPSSRQLHAQQYCVQGREGERQRQGLQRQGIQKVSNLGATVAGLQIYRLGGVEKVDGGK
eukprot:m.57403 g.57403  ORF g.57403 m.57403 type:complete len:70 (-) comp7072_c0_seq2:3386-3595(-)